MQNGDQGWVTINKKRRRGLIMSVQGELLDVLVVFPKGSKEHPDGGKFHTVVPAADFRLWASPGTGWRHGII